MSMPSAAAALQYLQSEFDAMPPVAAQQVRVAGYADGRMRLSAPLEANVNDKHCAFGGSLVTLLTLAGWSLVTHRLHEHGLVADVFVADSRIRYLAPLYADLQAEAVLARDADLAQRLLGQHMRITSDFYARQLCGAASPSD